MPPTIARTERHGTPAPGQDTAVRDPVKAIRGPETVRVPRAVGGPDRATRDPVKATKDRGRATRGRDRDRDRATRDRAEQALPTRPLIRAAPRMPPLATAARVRTARPLQSPSGRRRRFVSDRRRFAASLRSFDAAVGFVFRRRGGGGAAAVASVAASRSRAASRLRYWDRCSDAEIVRTPSTRRRERRWSARARWIGPSAVLFATSKLSSTRESVVLTLCPPGPDA